MSDLVIRLVTSTEEEEIENSGECLETTLPIDDTATCPNTDIMMEMKKKQTTESLKMKRNNDDNIREKVAITTIELHPVSTESGEIFKVPDFLINSLATKQVDIAKSRLEEERNSASNEISPNNLSETIGEQQIDSIHQNRDEKVVQKPQTISNIFSKIISSLMTEGI